LKEKRKRTATKSLRKTVFRLLLKIGIVLGAITIVATLCLFYMFWQIGEHEHKRALLRFGLDESKEIPDRRNDELPDAELEYDSYKRELLELVENGDVLIEYYDFVQIDSHHVWHCIYGYYGLLLGTSENLDTVLDRFGNWAKIRGLRNRVAYRGLNERNIPWKTEFIYHDKHTLYPRYGVKLTIQGESSDREPAPHSHPDYATYLSLSLRYVDVTCYERDN